MLQVPYSLCRPAGRQTLQPRTFTSSRLHDRCAVVRYPGLKTMPIRIVQVDAFTNRPFAGNPAAVCVLEGPKPDEWLRDVAREMNLSETAFLVPRNGEYDLRWLTPAVE